MHRLVPLCLLPLVAGSIFADSLTLTVVEWQDISSVINSLQPSCNQPGSCTTRIDPPATNFSDAYHSATSSALVAAAFNPSGPTLRVLTNTNQTRFSDDTSQLTTNSIASEAVFQDSLSVNGAGASSLRVFYQFDGNYSFTGTTLGVQGGLLVSDTIEHARSQGTVLQTFPIVLSNSSTINRQSSVLFNFESGSANIAFNLSSIAVCNLIQSGSCSSSADFSNTFRITSVQVLDSNGNAVTNASLTSASGVDYLNLQSSPPTTPPTPVPEPGTHGIVLAGAALLIVSGSGRTSRAAMRTLGCWLCSFRRRA